MSHPTKWVKHPLDGPIEIDVRLAPLIRLLWQRGIETNECCQEFNPGLACIEFPGTTEAMEFLEVAQEDYRVEVEKWDEGEPGCLAIVVRLRGSIAIEGWSVVMAAVLVLGGLHLLTLGVLGEYLWRTLDEVKRRPLYLVDRVLHGSPEPGETAATPIGRTT